MAGGSESNKIKEAFERVKDDINELKKEIIDQKKQIYSLKNEIKDFLVIKKENKDNLDLKEISIGNEGVYNDEQRWTTMNNDAQRSATMDNDEQPFTTMNDEPSLFSKRLKSTVKSLDQALTFKFRTLSDREFSVFVALYEIVKKVPETTYLELAEHLSINETTVKVVVNRLIGKGLPIKKERFLNKKVSLSINKDFFDLNLLEKLISLRQNAGEQKTLLDIE